MLLLHRHVLLREGMLSRNSRLCLLLLLLLLLPKPRLLLLLLLLIHHHLLRWSDCLTSSWHLLTHLLARLLLLLLSVILQTLNGPLPDTFEGVQIGFVSLCERVSQRICFL